MKKKILLVIPILLTFAVYFNSLEGDFVWDDQTIVIRNDAVKSFANISYVFSNEFAKKAGYDGNIYRPTQEISYMVDYFLWGNDPKGFHLSNILLHLLCVILLFFLVNAITGSLVIAAIASSIFGIHPINTEAIAYISGRSDPIYILFLLISFTLYIRSRALKGFKSNIYYMFSIVAYAASLVSRETALIFPFLVLSYDKFASAEKKISWPRIAPFIGLVVAYAFLRLNVIELNTERIGFFGLNTIIFTDAKIILKYLTLLLFPFNLHMERSMGLANAMDSEVLAGLAVVIPLMILSLRLKKQNPKKFFWVLWFFLFLLPHLNILKLNALYAEHWIYGASIGAYVLFAYGLERFVKDVKKRPIAYISCAAVILYLAPLTIARNSDWKDEPSIYSNTLKYTKSPKVLSNFGVYYEINSEYDKAIEVYKEALRISPRETWYHNNIAISYLKKGDREKAIYHWKTSLNINPRQEKIRAYLRSYNKEN